MAEIWSDDDAHLGVVQRRNVAVLGYAGQGYAHALSLRDSGVDVRVGTDAASSRAAAAAAGLRVVSPYEACEEADLVVMLEPDSAQRALYAEAVEPNLVAGDTLLFGSGFNLRYGYLRPPAEIDVVLVAPMGPGRLVRREFEEGRGVPVFVAVEQDPTGSAWELALSYAKAIGGTRAGGVRTTVAELTEAHLFGEQAVRGGGLSALVLAGFETLTSAGYSPEVAYVECLHGLKQVVDSMYADGIAHRAVDSDTFEYADSTAGPAIIDESVTARMRAVLTRIQDGSWAADFVADSDGGAPAFARLAEARAQHPIEHAGRLLRPRMGWLHADGDVDGADPW
jgi:ketol-acid reductoisomerase